MGLGTSVGGWKIIKTVGGQIMKIRPVNGVADLSSSLVIFGATFIHLPVSTTHVISSSILGLVLSPCERVKWGTAKRMLITWVITLPISASLVALFYYLLHFVLIKSRLPYFSRKTTFCEQAYFSLKACIIIDG